MSRLWSEGGVSEGSSLLGTVKVLVHLAPAYEGGLLEVLPLHDYEGMMAFSGGEAVGNSPQRVVRRVRCAIGDGEKSYFLKRTYQRRALDFLKAALKAGPSRIITDRERHLLGLHEEVGVPVMRIAAWGRKDVLGVPVSGFLLVEGVEGEDYGTVYHRMGYGDRLKIMAAYGSLVGHMHRKGLDSLVRTTDIICVSQSYDDFKESFVLIDREWGELKLSPIPWKVRLKRLATMLIKAERWLGVPSRREILSFLGGYTKEASGGDINPGSVYREVTGELAGMIDYDPCDKSAVDLSGKPGVGGRLRGGTAGG